MGRANNLAGLLDVNGVIGYATGFGGTVTQATNKGTSVTLNKAVGKITMNNAALAAGGRAGFQCNNSLVSVNDTVIASIDHGSATNAGYNYSVVASASAGAIVFVIKNESGGSLSEAVAINFAVIKGATA